ncbi:beta-trefoil DNA-binding domain-containing protein [Spinellus fusiger]|nr:beta-trefoil DNA-binding domain-containing protein [Spinellus fusiger]
MGPELLHAIVQQYLSKDPSVNKHTITILTGKVAQKSYGTEKRFLCPPPTTLLTGDWTGESQQSPKLTIQISGETTYQTGVLEWHNQQGTVLDSSTPFANVVGNQDVSGKCVSKQLHINDADEKRKRVQVMVKLQHGVHSFGTLASKGIKVISKPSKKRQSAKNMDLCIHHGATISLFNRIRSQTVSTKYLGVSRHGGHTQQMTDPNGTCFVARTSAWDPFVIWIVDTERKTPSLPSSLYPLPPAIALAKTPEPTPIHYNQPVVLQCVTTGLVSPVMIIRKIERGSMAMGGSRTSDGASPTGGEYGDEVLGDPVSQLHKIAFQIIQEPSSPTSLGYSSEWVLPHSCQPISYLACLNEVVGMHKSTSSRTLIKQERRPVISEGPRRNSTDLTMDGHCWTEDVSDAAVWTIVGTDCASYTFWTPPTCHSNINTFPVVHQTQQAGPAKERLTLMGSQFTSDLTVWFGDIESPSTEYRSKDHLSCVVPDTHRLGSSPYLQITDTSRQLPLLLVRRDGVVFQTDCLYTFSSVQ